MSLFIDDRLVHRMYHHAQHIGDGSRMKPRIFIKREKILYIFRPDIRFSIYLDIALSPAQIGTKLDDGTALTFSAHIGILTLAEAAGTEEKHESVSVFAVQRIDPALDMIYASLILGQAFLICRFQIAQDRKNIVFVAVCQVMVL